MCCIQARTETLLRLWANIERSFTQNTIPVLLEKLDRKRRQKAIMRSDAERVIAERVSDGIGRMECTAIQISCPSTCKYD